MTLDLFLGLVIVVELVLGLVAATACVIAIGTATLPQKAVGVWNSDRRTFRPHCRRGSDAGIVDWEDHFYHGRLTSAAALVAL
jgi:hypothetical protein